MQARLSNRCRWGFLILLSGFSAVYGQGSLSVNPTPLFLNANLNGAPVGASLSISSRSGAVRVSLALPTVPWLTIGSVVETTPATIIISGNPAGLGVGVYNTTLNLTESSGAATVVPVLMTVNDPASALSVNPNFVVFNAAPGGANPPTQQLTLSSNVAVTYSVASNSSLFSIPAPTGQASPGNPASVAIGINPAALNGPGTYTGSITISSTTGPPLVVPVILQFSSTAQLTSSISPVVFNQPFSLQNPTAQQTITIFSTGVPITFKATPNVITTTGNTQWLSVSPQTSTTAAALTITINTTGLGTGQYRGSIDLLATDSSGAALSIPVSLNYNAPLSVSLSPTTLAFNYSVGGAAPAHQAVTPTTTADPQPYTVSATTTSGTWLKATAGAATPAPVDVFIDPTGLGVGTYNGTVTVTVPTATNSPQSVAVTLTVTNNPNLTSPDSTNGLTFNFENGQAQPAPQTTTVTSSNGSAVGFSVSTTQNNTSNGVTWLLAGGSSTTPATVNVAVNGNGMAAGRYTGAVVVTSPGGNPLSIPVTLNVSNAGSPLVSVTPTSVTFNSATGAGVNPQNVTVMSTGEALSYSVTGSVVSPQGGNWLVLSAPGNPASAGAPSTFFVSAQPFGLAQGTYTANVTVQPLNGNPAVVIPVTLTVAATNLILSPGTLNFTQNSGGPAPGQQTINISTSGPSVTFNASVTGGSWLTVSPASGAAPATLTVSVNGAGLSPGNYTGQVVVTAPSLGNASQVVTVNLTVAASQSFTLSSPSLTFNSTAGSAPATQTVTLTAPSGAFPFNATAAVSAPAGGNWLSVSPSAGTASASPTALTVSVNPLGLSAGTYTGTITISSPSAPPQAINVTYVVSALPTPVLANVENGASFQPGAVAPGEIITITGTGIGPVNPVVSPASPGSTLPTQVLGTQVTFDGIAAPLLYVSSTQINAIVPYAIGGRTQTRLVVIANNANSSGISLNVTDSAPAIFPNSTPGLPASQGAILNENGTVNTPNNPATRGSVIVIFATGEGATSPVGLDGFVIPIDPNALKHPVLPVKVTIGGYPADIQYAGSAPGLVSGAVQINAVVPDGTGSGSTIPVVLTVGNNSSPNVTTLAIQ